MSKRKHVQRMVSAFKSCQRPWEHAIIQQGDSVIIPGQSQPQHIYRLDNDCRRYMQVHRNPHLPGTRAFVFELNKWLIISDMLRW